MRLQAANQSTAGNTHRRREDQSGGRLAKSWLTQMECSWFRLHYLKGKDHLIWWSGEGTRILYQKVFEYDEQAWQEWKRLSFLVIMIRQTCMYICTIYFSYISQYSLRHHSDRERNEIRDDTALKKTQDQSFCQRVLNFYPEDPDCKPRKDCAFGLVHCKLCESSPFGGGDMIALWNFAAWCQVHVVLVKA